MDQKKCPSSAEYWEAVCNFCIYDFTISSVFAFMRRLLIVTKSKEKEGMGMNEFLQLHVILQFHTAENCSNNLNLCRR